MTSKPKALEEDAMGGKGILTGGALRAGLGELSLIVCLIVLPGLLLLAASPAEATFPGGQSGKIAFQSDRDGNYEIYSMDPNGANQTRLTINGASDQHPEWSPDGTKIVFDSTRDGNYEIYTMNADGSGQTRITNNAAFDEFPGWSADGTKIVFDSGRDDPNSEIYTMNANGTGVTRLTNNPAFDAFPAWSPTGAKIAWQSTRNGGQYDIYAMNPDGTTPTRLTTSPATDEYPNWRNDGLYVWFDSNSSGSYDLYGVNLSGTIVASIGAGGDQVAPAPPPHDNDSDPTRHETVAGNTDIYNSFSRLTTNPATDAFPDWQPIIKNHVRPKGATPLFVPLVPAYADCFERRSQHAAPIDTSSCVPAPLESTYLTVGTPDVNAEGANFIGSVRISSRVTAPADGLIKVSTADVRCAGTSGGCSGGPLSDYLGNLRFDAGFRITDRGSAAGNTAATLNDMAFNFTVPCTSTASTTTGSACSISTTINTVLGGGAITAGRRAVWQLSGAIQLFDGGPDGVASTTAGNTLFAIGGVFFP